MAMIRFKKTNGFRSDQRFSSETGCCTFYWARSFSRACSWKQRWRSCSKEKRRQSFQGNLSIPCVLSLRLFVYSFWELLQIFKEPESLEERILEAATPVDAIRFPFIFEQDSSSTVADDDSNIPEGKVSPFLPLTSFGCFCNLIDKHWIYIFLVDVSLWTEMYFSVNNLKSTTHLVPAMR